MGVDINLNEMYGDTHLRLDFPDSWEVKEIRMLGHDRPVMTVEEIRDAINHPIGTPTISELARGKRGRIVITCDDIQRPTPAHAVFPYIIEELHKAGISSKQILVIFALGTHYFMSSDQFACKIGWDMVQKYNCVNHNCREHLIDIGTTSRNTPLKANYEFLKADLRISICGIKKHPTAGAGGGGKAVLPGVASVEAIRYNHSVIRGGTHNLMPYYKIRDYWKIKDNAERLDMQEAGRMANLDVVVNCIYNNKRELVGLYVGDLEEAWREAVRVSYKIHSTPMPDEKVDIVVSNSYPQANKGVEWDCVKASLRDGGSAVGIKHFPLGSHGIYGFVTEWGGWWNRVQGYPDKPWPVKQAGQIIIYDPRPTKNDMLRVSGKVQFVTTWEETVKRLRAFHGEDATVAVFPYAQLQFDPAKYPLQL